MNAYAVNHQAQGLRIGIVQARFSDGIGSELLAACEAQLLAHGVAAADIHVATVPGALEVPVVLQSMAKSQKFDALVALGVIIRGETYHFELVANESGAGVSRVSLDYNVPIANAILTTEDEEQAIVRMRIKGAEAATAAVEVANLLKAVSA